MPMTADDLADIRPKLEAAKQNPVNFAACLGKTPHSTVIIFSKTKDPKSLVPIAKKAGDSTKTTFGSLTVAEGLVTLKCADEVPSGLCKKLKGLFTLQKLTFKVRAFDPSGKAADLGDDDDDDKGVMNPSGNAPESPVADLPEQTAPVGPVTAAPNAQPGAQDAATERPGERNEAWDKVIAAVRPRVLDYVRSGAEKAAQVAAAWKGAVAAADAGRHDDAMAVVSKIVPLLRQAAMADPADVTTESASPGTPSPVTPSAESEAREAEAEGDAPGSEDFTKAARIWRETFKAMEAEMQKLKSAITAYVSPDPALAGVVADAADLPSRLDAFDLDLSVALETIGTASPDEREDLRKDAIGHLTRYSAALDTPFFRDVDDANGFVKVAVAATARRSLGAVSKILA